MHHFLKIRGLMVLSIFALGMPICQASSGSEFSVYSIYQGLNLGGSGEVTQKDFYVNMGSTQGISKGTQLQVYRHIPTFDLVSQQVYRDVTFPIAWVKVIHVEPNVAIARLVNFLPPDQSATISPKAIMVGDRVRVEDTAVVAQELKPELKPR